MATDSTFPAGQILVREFQTITDAHVFASGVSAPARLVDVSPTAGGAWVCVWSAEDQIAILEKKFGSSAIKVDAKFMNALLSLGPKPSPSTSHIGIVEAENISDVFKASSAYAESGAALLEIRVKRSGGIKGAYAFFALENADAPAKPESYAKVSLLKMTVIPLSGDYRRYFL